MASDAFIVGEDWISEHYFNTDSTKQSLQARVNALRKVWDEREAAGEETPKSRFVAARQTVLSALAVGAEDTEPGEADVTRHRTRVLEPIVRTLGYDDSRWRRTTAGPVTFLAPADGIDAPAGALVLARRVSDVSDLLAKRERTLVEAFTPADTTTELRSVPQALSWLFSLDDAPAYAVVIAGSHGLLVERERWAEGRYLAVDLSLVLDRNDAKKRGGEFDRAVAVLAAESMLPDVDGSVWWTDALDDSVKHTVGVSKDLREGVRESIELIANEVVRRRTADGLEPLPAAKANVLARQSLRYLYRILFLLYAEASPELKVLPIGAAEYALGYGLDRLRELVLVELGAQSRHRTHLHESLGTLFRLVDAGHDAHEAAAGDADAGLPQGLAFHALNADLFGAKATTLIDEIGLGDGALQQVLQRLLLTKEESTNKGHDRGFISYADLGINQLGAVYEGLMSYTGFFAEEDLYEVAKDGDASKGSWVVPVARSQGIPDQHFVQSVTPTGESRPRRYGHGEFVYRLSGRDRQTSASYYSPEVLTTFVVGQALEELLDQDGHTTTAAEILQLSVCEPALGSGAFAIEAVRQLAEHYLSRREREVGHRIDPEDRPRELQKAKAAIALHQVYGVDLNATAVELAEISLWLDTMVDGLQAPWFGLRLRAGNSLIGARRAVYSEKQIKDRAWLKDTPTDVPVATLVDDMRDGRLGSATSGKIHHFLLPAEGWGAAVDAKEGKELSPDSHAALKQWRAAIRRKPDTKQLAKLKSLSMRVEQLWQFALRRLEIAEAQVRREVELWEDPRDAQASANVVSRTDVEEFLNDEDGAYQRLRRVMDAWCALWFWPLTDTLTGGVAPPPLDQWLDGLATLLGGHSELTARRAGSGSQTLAMPTDWSGIVDAERWDLDSSSAWKVSDVLTAHPWLAASERIAKANRFFHWELDFAGVFARGGFDLQVGNPPWVRPEFDEFSVLAEADTWFALASKPPTREVSSRRSAALSSKVFTDSFLNEATEVTALRAFLSHRSAYPSLEGLRPDLYRCFMARTWNHLSPTGIVALIHYETHLTDERAGHFRAELYPRLRRHWHFVNELRLFEIQDQKQYGVSVLGSPGDVSFLNASWLYHPSTVERSLKHDGSGPEPGLKDDDGNWDLRAHSGRIEVATDETLQAWHALLETEGTPTRQTRMAFSTNRATTSTLSKVARAPRLATLELEFSQGWNETTDFNRGLIHKDWGRPSTWQDVILQGPHIFVSSNFYKHPNSTMLHQQDWSTVDLEHLSSDEIPITSYKPSPDRESYDAAYTHWRAHREPARSRYRVAWRAMAANTGERTLAPAIIPPGAAHVHGISALASYGPSTDTLDVAVSMSSLVADLSVRAAPKNGIPTSTVRRLPAMIHPNLIVEARARALRLHAVTCVFSSLLEETYSPGMSAASWAGGLQYLSRPTLGIDHQHWTPDVPLRRASDRRQAQVEIDAIVALSLGITADELCTIYRTQFAVLYGYDRNSYFYDANGRLVPNEVLKVWRQKGEAVTLDERQAVHPGSGVTYTYEPPFVTLDREADMRQAYAHFEKILAERS